MSTVPTRDGAFESVRAPHGSNFVVRGGYVVTMDPAVGDLARGAVHVRDGAIVAVAPDNAAPADVETIDAAGMIVMPGFIESHIHLWNAILRNMLRPGLEYFPLKYALGSHFLPRDTYRSTRLALIELLNAGVTTVNNFAHNVRSPEHADAELRAMAEAGLCGRYSYGWPDSVPNDRPAPLDDVARVRGEWFGARGPFEDRVDLGLAVRGPMYTASEIYGAEFRAARELGLPVILHAGQNRRRMTSAASLRREGFLDASVILVHCLLFDDADRAAVAEAGASVSFSPHSELRNQEDGASGDFRNQMLRMLDAGVNATLSIDAHAVAPVSMFETMSLAWYIGIPWRGTATEGLPFLDFRRCLEMVTINAARALGIADRTGSLTAGKRADMILIRATDLNMAPWGEVDCALVRTATVANVDTVIVDGRVMKRGGRLVGVDIPTVTGDAVEALRDVRQRAGGPWIQA